MMLNRRATDKENSTMIRDAILRSQPRAAHAARASFTAARRKVLRFIVGRIKSNNRFRNGPARRRKSPAGRALPTSTSEFGFNHTSGPGPGQSAVRGIEPVPVEPGDRLVPAGDLFKFVRREHRTNVFEPVRGPFLGELHDHFGTVPAVGLDQSRG